MQSFGFVAQRLIASGPYTLLYEVTRRGDERKYALKRNFIFDSKRIKQILRERKILERVSGQSNFFPTLYSAIWLETSTALVMTAGCGIDLYDLLDLHDTLSESQAKFYTAEILCGLEQLHNLKILHLDLKLENFLIMNTGHIMIADFNHSMDISPNPQCDPPKMPGTVIYMAPEVARGETPDEKADIWSWAVVLVELIHDCVRDVEKSDEELLEVAKTEEIDLEPLKTFSKGLQDLVKLCFNFTPKERPSISEIKASEFFSDIDWKEVEECRLSPPFAITESDIESTFRKKRHNPYNRQILNNLNEGQMVNIMTNLLQPDGSYQHGHFRQDLRELERTGYTEEHISELFADFTFARFEDECRPKKRKRIE